MYEQLPIFPDAELTKISQEGTHFYAKRDIARIWGIVDLPQFEKMLGEEGKQLLGWRRGQQRFSPRKVRELIELLGTPLKKSEIGR